MRGAYCMSANLLELDALWRQYINSDPDLRRLEKEKRALARKHRVKAHRRQQRTQRRRMWRAKIIDALATAAIGMATTAIVLLMLALA